MCMLTGSKGIHSKTLVEYYPNKPVLDDGFINGVGKRLHKNHYN